MTHSASSVLSQSSRGAEDAHDRYWTVDNTVETAGRSDEGTAGETNSSLWASVVTHDTVSAITGVRD